MQSHDYRLPGAYFVTLCTQGRARHFGDVIDRRMRLSPAGQVVQRAWTHLPESFDRVSLDVFVVMPDHFHGIVWLGDRGDICASMASRDQDGADISMVIGADDWHGTVSGSLGAIMQNFKSVTTRKIRAAGLVTNARVWQRNYWERLIRTERELQVVRAYIANNPANWSS